MFIYLLGLWHRGVQIIYTNFHSRVYAILVPSNGRWRTSIFVQARDIQTYSQRVNERERERGRGSKRIRNSSIQTNNIDLHTWARALKSVNQIFHAAQYRRNSTVMYSHACIGRRTLFGYIRLSLLFLLLLLNTPAIARLPLNNNLLF